MKISAGIIIKKGDEILLGHATGTSRWDIPKGGIEKDESPLEASVRETKEEFDIDVPKNELKNLGEMDYIPNKKKLHLFLWEVKEFPDISSLKCSSYFERNGKKIPEMDGYEVVKFSDLKKYVGKSLFKLLNNLKY